MASITPRQHLFAILWARIQFSEFHASLNYFMAFILMLVTVLAGPIAGICGLAKLIPTQAVGAIALIPSATALMATVFKFQEKSNWHTRKAKLLTQLRTRIDYETTDAATEAVATIAREKDRIEEELTREWEGKLGFNFAAFLAHR